MIAPVGWADRVLLLIVEVLLREVIIQCEQCPMGRGVANEGMINDQQVESLGQLLDRRVRELLQ